MNSLTIDHLTGTAAVVRPALAYLSQDSQKHRCRVGRRYCHGGAGTGLALARLAMALAPGREARESKPERH